MTSHEVLSKHSEHHANSPNQYSSYFQNSLKKVISKFPGYLYILTTIIIKTDNV